MESEKPKFIKELSHLLRTQDNRATSCPLYCVQEVDRIYGLESEYADKSIWLDKEEHEFVADTDKELRDYIRETHELPDGFEFTDEQIDLLGYEEV